MIAETLLIFDHHLRRLRRSSALLRATAVKPEQISEVILGQVLTAGVGQNPARQAVIRSGLLMLRHLGEPEAALKIRNALEKVYRHRDKLTRDVGGKASTSEFADAIIEAMQSAEVPQTPEPSRA